METGHKGKLLSLRRHGTFPGLRYGAVVPHVSVEREDVGDKSDLSIFDILIEENVENN